MKDKDYFLFSVLMVLFCGFASFSVLSFFSSTKEQIDRMKASVIENDKSLAMIEGVTDVNAESTADSGIVYPVFKDVSSVDPGAKAIEALMNAGIINGYSDGTFGPEKLISRAEVTSLLVNARDADIAGRDFSSCFKDVNKEWFASYICYCKDAAWVSGYEDGNFRPHANVTRSEILKMVLEVFGFEVPLAAEYLDFDDVKGADWFAAYVYVAVNEGFVVEGGRFGPNDQVTRREVAELMYAVMMHQELL